MKKVLSILVLALVAVQFAFAGDVTYLHEINP